MVDNNSTSTSLTQEHQFDFLVHYFTKMFDLQINPDSTINNFQYTIQDPEDSNHTLLLEYNRITEELNIHALKHSMKCTLIISENEFQNELNDMTFKVFLKQIITLEVDKDAGARYNTNLEVLLEDIEKLDKLEPIILDLFFMLCGTIMGSTVYQQLLNS